MAIINLSPDFNPLGSGPYDTMSFDAFTFSGGEPHIKIVPPIGDDLGKVWITQRIDSFNDLGLLLVTVDAIRRINNQSEVRAVIPYFPGARQDRVMVKGEPLTCKIYADIINSINLETLWIFDPHSDVTPSLLNNCTVINNHLFIKEAFRDASNMYAAELVLISPDAGSNKKAKDLVKYLNSGIFAKPVNVELVKCDKTRDVSTGEITGFEVYTDSLKDKDCLIVDDICDGGGTFTGLAEVLRDKGADQLFLAVSHGIFSKGMEDLGKYFTQIYTTDSIDISDDRINVNKLSRIRINKEMIINA